ncbi:3-oxoacyl-[acyl-carrier-protein] reductase FabG [Roseovarius litorisediminis]|uniref:3-oxoacyl-[acyl-carrier-protein] reductase FabG n=1 Tax=Roseovarius litorisediminis TaxID=1312363 RepID=A0A1Y5RDX5_9RHOB|nr:SDR family oxidoreductase [Roseovarius litorisediminis]SLN12636.1 3-oxoacyl-[acyl-carrier-protein] reductase FabG [Roseovarius litorisediminis]
MIPSQRWTLITGASLGLGAEFARIAAAEGRNLILTARSIEKLNALADELRAMAGDIVVIPADLSDLRQVETLWEKAVNGRCVDMLVNNAGLGQHGLYSDPETWPRELVTLNVNVTALSYLMKQAIPHMQAAGGGRIMNLASTAGFMPGPNMAVYHASKAYVLSLSEAVAEELRGTNVTVSAICPGATETAFFDAANMRGIGLLKVGNPASAQSVAKAAWNATLSGRRVLVTGLINNLFAFSPRLAPRRLVSFIAGKVMAKW